MAKGDVITRKDIMTDEALKVGVEFKEQMEIASKSVDILLDKMKEFDRISKNIRGANTQKDFIILKQQEALATQQSIDAIKKLEAAEISADKIKRSNIQTLELERKARVASEQAQKKANTEKEKSVKLTLEERVQNELANRAEKQAILAKFNLTEAYTKLSNERTRAKNILRDLIASESASTAEIKKAKDEFDRLEAKVKKADNAVNDFTKNVGNYPTITKLTGNLKDLVGAFGITAGVGAFAAGLKDAFDTLKKFEQGVADLSAITGASGKDLEFLKKQAIELGKTTKGGAIQVVEAYKLIASAKPELLENVESLNAVTQATITLAKASGLDLPAAATALTDAMNQFGAPAEEASVFIDALANGAKFGAAEIPQVTEALLKFGAVARSSNISIQESTALIELLAENGIKGADAGTALRNVLLKISAPDALPKEAQKALKDLGISFETLKDKSVPIQEKFEALRPLLADNGKLLKAFGFENTVAARNIIEHTDRLKELTGKMNEFGTAEEQATIKSNTLQGKTDKLISTYDSLVLSLGNGSGVVSKFFKFFVDGSESALNNLIRLNTSFDDLFNQASLEGKSKGVKEFQKQFSGIFTEGISNEKEVALRIKDQAISLRKTYQEEIEKTNKRINELESGSTLNGGVVLAIRIRNNKAEKEELVRRSSEQLAIIQEADKKIKGVKSKSLSDDKNLNQQVENQDKESIDNLKKSKDDYLKFLKENYEKRRKIAEDEFNLNQFRLQQLIDINEEISKDEKESTDVRIEALFNSFQLRTTLIEGQLKRELQLQGVYNEKTGVFERDLSDQQIQEVINTGKTTEKLTAEQQLIYEKFQKNKTGITKTESEIRQGIIDSEIAKIKKLTDAQLLSKDTNLKNEEGVEFDRFKVELINAQGNQKLIEEATEAHERKLLEIRRRYSKEALNIQLNDLENLLIKNDAIVTSDKFSAEKRNQIVNQIAGFRKEVNALDVENVVESNNKKIVSDQEYAERQKEISQRIKDVSFELKDALVNLANTLFDAKIQNIDFEMQKNDEFYNRQIELAGNDERQKNLLQKERDRKNTELENKKRKESIKQAIFNKVLALAEIGLNTAKSVTAIASTGGGTYYADFGASAATLTALTIALGAAQAAAVLATPLPKYKDGRMGGKKEKAVINDGGVPEVLERSNGQIEVYRGKNKIVQLYEGDNVHKSVEDYNKFQRQNMVNSINSDNMKVNSFMNAKHIESVYDKQILNEMRLTRKAIEKNKPLLVKEEKIDLAHELWKMKNLYWN